MHSQLIKLIRRMIDTGYSDEDIVERIRCSPEAIDAVKRLIVLEAEKKAKSKADDDYAST